MRTEKEVKEFFVNNLKNSSIEGEKNRHLPFIMGDVIKQLSSRHNISLPLKVNEYSNFLRQSSEKVWHEIKQDETIHLADIAAVSIKGSAAFGVAVPFHAKFEDEILPEQALILTEDVYTWLFTSLAKSSQLANLRLLDNDNSSQLELSFIITDGKSFDSQRVLALIEETYVSLFNFCPPITLAAMDLSKLTFDDLISSYIIHGKDLFIQFQKKTLQRPEIDHLYPHYSNAVQEITQDLSNPLIVADLKRSAFLELSDQMVRNYLRIRMDGGESVLMGHLSTSEASGIEDSWWQQNEELFEMLKSNDFDKLLVEDATKELGDIKGSQKENQYTLCRVLGLKKGDQIIPAKRMMLKLRGLSWYRGEINNLFDAIKEFASYTFINQNVSDPGRYFLNSGPFLLTCEKLDVPYDSDETGNWVGIFLEELSPLNQDKVFTCRVRRLSDFWSLDETLKRVLREAAKDNIELEIDQVAAHLRKLSKWLWTQNLSIDYCDLSLMYDQEGNINQVTIIDLERLSFGELVNEEHTFLEALIDLKSYLLPEYWFYILENIYSSRKSPGEYIRLLDVHKYLRKPSKKRILTIKILHTLEGITGWFGPRVGLPLWRTVLNSLSTINLLRYRIYSNLT